MKTMSKIKEKDFKNICCFVSEFNKKAEQNGEVNLTPRETDSEYIEINGDVNVYSQHLAVLFFSIEPIRAQNSITLERYEINPKDLLAIYTEGYKEGVKQFSDEYRLTMKDLTTIDTENHVEALKASYFHNGGWMSLNGWVSAKSTVFSSFTLERLKEFGKESGLLSEADKYIKLNPTIFKDFHATNDKYSEQPEPQAQAQAHTQTKQGRPKTVIHEASYYLHNKELLQFLIDNYSNTTPQIFNQLLSVLADIEVNQLKPATKKEYKEAFGKALNVRQRQSNFDNYFNTRKIDEIFEPIKATIKTYLNGN